MLTNVVYNMHCIIPIIVIHHVHLKLSPKLCIVYNILRYNAVRQHIYILFLYNKEGRNVLNKQSSFIKYKMIFLQLVNVQNNIYLNTH